MAPDAEFLTSKSGKGNSQASQNVTTGEQYSFCSELRRSVLRAQCLEYSSPPQESNISSLFSNNRIDPPQGWESCKIFICGIKYASMLDCQGGQMSICNEITACTSLFDLCLEYPPMKFCWPHNADTGLIQPAIHSHYRLFNKERLFMNPWIGRNSDKCIDDRPREIYLCGATQNCIPPYTHCIVLH